MRSVRHRAPGVPWRPLPAHRGPRERAVVRAARHGALPPLRIDAQFDVQISAVQRAQAVAQPVVPPHLGRPDADPRRPHEAAVRRHATLPQAWIQPENWEFETHRRSFQ